MSLKELTLNEAEEVAGLISSSSSAGGGVEIGMDNDQLKKILCVILEKSDGGKFEPGDLKETEALEVLKDFFTKRINLGISIRKDFERLTKNTLMQ